MGMPVPLPPFSLARKGGKMYQIVGAWTQAILLKAGDVCIATYNLLASLIGK